METITYKETKDYLKALALEIRELKSTRKQWKDGYVPGLWSKQRDYRIKHIAMSMFRGKTIEEIEPTARYEYPSKAYWVNEANAYLEKLVYSREAEDEEVLRDCA